MKTKTLGAILIALSSLLYATEAVVSQLCYNSGWSYVPLMVFRFGFALIFVTLFVLIIKKPLLLERSAWGLGLLVAILELIATSSLYMAFALLPAATAILIAYCYPIITAIFAYFINKEKLTPVTFISLILLIGGIIVFSGTVWGDLNVWGMVAALMCAVFNSLYLIMLDRLMYKGAEPSTFMIYNFGLSFLVYFIIASISGQLLSVPTQAISWVYLLFIAIVPTSIAVLLLNFGIDKIGATLTAIVFGLEVPASAFFAFLVFGDTWNAWQFLGAILIISAVMLPNIIQIRKDRQNMLLVKTGNGGPDKVTKQ